MARTFDPPRNQAARELYLDLMKRCLADFIYIDDPLSAMVLVTDLTRRGGKRRRLLAKSIIAGAARLLGHYRIKLAEYPGGKSMSPADIEQARTQGVDWPGRAHTMIGLRRLDHLQHCVETAIRESVPGDCIETGVWRGGASIFIRAVLKAHGDTQRVVWVADSFDGLPPPDGRYPADAGANWHTLRFLAVKRRDVERNFARYGLLDSQVRFLEGWFRDTLPGAPIERLAVLRLDGDMYQSTIDVLDALYGKLSPGGGLIVDWSAPLGVDEVMPLF